MIYKLTSLKRKRAMTTKNINEIASAEREHIFKEIVRAEWEGLSDSDLEKMTGGRLYEVAVREIQSPRSPSNVGEQNSRENWRRAVRTNNITETVRAEEHSDANLEK